MTRFEGWPPEAIEWFHGLLADNSREYFTTTKKTYEQAVKAPMVALLVELEDEFGPGKLFRPNRDTRFSPDKTPYKTYAAAFTGQVHHPGYYVQISAEGLTAGGGVHGMAREDVAAFRAAIDDDRAGSQLEDAVAQVEAAGLDIGGETLKTAPRGFPKDHARARLLRFTNLIGWRETPPSDLLHSRDALGWVRDSWQACRPIVTWLDHRLRAATD